MGIGIAIGLVAGISSSLQYHFLLAPFGATAVIAFLLSDTPAAAPKRILGGYLVTSIIGVGVAIVLGHSWWTYALGVALAMLIKKMLDVVHPPSAAVPILLISLDEGKLFEFVADDLLPGLAVLVGVAIVYNRYIVRNGYPLWK